MKLLVILSQVLCYSYKVHGYLGELVKENLHPERYSTLLKTIGVSDLRQASIWADKVKRTKKYSFTRTLHYMNIDSCEITQKDLETTTIYTAIVELTGNPNKTDLFKEVPSAEKLKFLLHFLQDISQPLHSYGKARGGNSMEVIRNKNNRNRTTNLHSLWDSEIPQTFVSSGNYIPTPLNVTLVDVINFNLKISCGYIYDYKDSYILFEEYYREDIIKEMFDNYLSLVERYL